MEQEIICTNTGCQDITNRECDEVFEDIVERIECELVRKAQGK